MLVRNPVDEEALVNRLRDPRQRGSLDLAVGEPDLDPVHETGVRMTLQEVERRHGDPARRRLPPRPNGPGRAPAHTERPRAEPVAASAPGPERAEAALLRWSDPQRAPIGERDLPRLAGNGPRIHAGWRPLAERLEILDDLRRSLLRAPEVEGRDPNPHCRGYEEECDDDRGESQPDLERAQAPPFPRGGDRIGRHQERERLT